VTVSTPWIELAAFSRRKKSSCSLAGRSSSHRPISLTTSMGATSVAWVSKLSSPPSSSRK
jgi:hypothetical protein